MKLFCITFFFLGLLLDNFHADPIGFSRFASPFPLNEISAKSGRIRSLVVFANFPEERSIVGESVPSFAQNLFLPELAGSLNHFYSEMSSGRLKLDGDVWPKRFNVSRPKESYRIPSGSYDDFVKEVIVLLDREIDLSQYDNDGLDGVPNSGDDDGYLDFLFIVIESAPVDFILRSATGIARLGLEKDYLSNDSSANGGTIRIRRDDSDSGVGGSLQRGKTFEEAVGSMAHEFGHYLGLPDLYNTGHLSQELEPDRESAGIGYWGLMGHGNRGWNEVGGPNPFCVWSLAQLGWLGESNKNLIILEGEQKSVEISDVRDGGKVFILPIQGSNSFYLVAYRRRVNSYYERNLPAEGILIWLVNPSIVDNNNEEKQLVSLVCADGKYADAGYPIGKSLKPFFGKNNLDFWSKDVPYRDQYAGNLGDATDVWDGIRYRDFWSASNPGALGGISIRNIELQDEIMRADFSTVDRNRAGPISKDETWTGNINIVGDVSIQPGVQLELREGTVIKVGEDILGMGRDPKKVEIKVFGNLIVNKAGENPVLFTSASENPNPGDWSGIVISEEGTGFLRRTKIEYAETGLVGEKMSNNGSVYRGNANRIELQEVVIRFSSDDGIRLRENIEPVLLSNVEINDNEGFGADIEGVGLVYIDNGVIANNIQGGVKRIGGFIELSNTEMVGNGEFGGANLTLGPKVFGKIIDNKLSGTIGLKCVETNEVVLKRNKFLNNEIGLYGLNSLLNISRNEWIDCELAMKFEGVIKPERLDLNTIIGDGLFVDADIENDVDATNNWWGLENSFDISQRMRGLVYWEPFLNFDPRVPLAFSLGAPYPNPVLTETIIEYQIGINDPIIEGQTRIKLEIRNVVGSLVRKIVDDTAFPGIYVANWDGCDMKGRNVASGFYYVQLEIGPIRQYRKLLVMR